MVKHLPSKHEALTSNSSTAKKKKKERERKKEKEKVYFWLTVWEVSVVPIALGLQ
jgi:hypothetical protein